MRNKDAPPAARVAAAVAVIDRGWGRAPQMVVSAHLGPRRASELSEAELLSIIEHAQQPSLPAPDGGTSGSD